MPSYRLSDFDFDLPDDLIAQKPAATRTASRLLHVGTDGHLVNRQFTDLLSILQPEDLLVFNNSKVIPARLYAQKPTGGQVELLIERITGVDSATALLRASKKPAAGTQLTLLSPMAPPKAKVETGGVAAGRVHQEVTLLGRDPAADDRFLLKFAGPVLDHLDVFGQLPLPPYIGHTPSAEDLERYQTVYAQHAGSVAAPTAGLHFDHAFLADLSKKGIARADLTLHVGSGTFAPVRHEDLSAHQMHAEWCSLSPETADALMRTRARGGRVVAVGTTSLRTLESAAARAEQGMPLHGHWETSLFITPGYRFRMVDCLLTNFHLPRSTLLMLVSAFAGYETIRAAYRHAIGGRYRFFSYGDAMFLSCSAAKP